MPMPAAIFPSKEIFIRVQAEGQNANLQVDAYTFRAQLENAKTHEVGKTMLLEERQIAKGLRVQAETTRDGDVVLRLFNKDGAARQFKVEARCSTAGKVVGDASSVMSISPRGRQVCLVEFEPTAHSIQELVDKSIVCVPLPAGVHTVTITAWENKTSVCEWVVEVPRTVISESAYGYTLEAQIPGTITWWCEGAWKVGANMSRERVPYDPEPVGGGITISAARGEYQHAQLVLYGDNADTTLQRAEVSELKGQDRSIPAFLVSLYEVAMVKVENPSDYFGEPGEYPDPLPPLVLPLKLPSNRNQAIWILCMCPMTRQQATTREQLASTTERGGRQGPARGSRLRFRAAEGAALAQRLRPRYRTHQTLPPTEDARSRNAKSTTCICAHSRSTASRRIRSMNTRQSR